MAWSDTRRAAREVVHRTFATSVTPNPGELTARYFPESDTGPGALVSVRVHNKVLLDGDLNNDGYAQRLVEVERVIFLQSEALLYQIRRKGILKFTDGRVYTLEEMWPPRDDYTVTFGVINRA